MCTYNSWISFSGQIPLLSERVHGELHVRLLELDPMGAPHRLDGSEWHQPAASLQWTGGHLAEGLSQDGPGTEGLGPALWRASIPSMVGAGEFVLT